ncbi:DUF5672 family protein [uncultured Sanguibacteroides sp.]|uniref:DUF5672 family protein n=1 Tax=uncultured Sanguibacteroides sp. TaxID=1635151 RepID=UPI0025F5C23B|nr:DUF5672 family protein [uncultured Sanguibacteroides sp.]
MNELVKIIIPVYKTDLNRTEIISLNQVVNVLKEYPKVIIKPDSLDITEVLDLYPDTFEVESFDDHYFAGIAGYNRLMLSCEFYERFLQVKYILIYQLDAFVFRDELTQWCQRGYDYIGAPWLCKLKYRKFPLNLFLKLRGAIYSLTGIKHRQQCFFKVGNGGFSLRKVDTCYRKTIEMQSRIHTYLSRVGESSQFNEDVFWALEATKNKDFSIPTWQEAIHFSFDLFPRICFQFAQKELPFGCHRWNKELNFWKDHINFPD